MPPIDPRILGLPPYGLAGCGVEGLETLRFLLAQGLQDVHLFDQRRPHAPSPEARALLARLPAARCHFGADWSALARCRTLLRSPGIPPGHPALQRARAAGAQITSATKWFLRLTASHTIGVTGSLGKGSTAHLLQAALQAAGLPCALAGNVGINPLSLLSQPQPPRLTALELSSFQLCDLEAPPAAQPPPTAVLLRIHPEHLDWHKDFAEYLEAKGRLLAPRGSQRVIYCAQSQGSRQLVQAQGYGEHEALAFRRDAPVHNGIGVQGGTVFRFAPGQAPRPLPQLGRLRMAGPFNVENAAAAWLAAEPFLDAAGAAAHQAALQALQNFPGLPHHLEHVGRRPVPQTPAAHWEYYNDSFSTRPQAALGALETFRRRPHCIILGGSDKGADFLPLAQALCRQPRLALAVLIGATAARLAQALHSAASNPDCTPPPQAHAEDLATALNHAERALPQGGAIILSPACASFDMFANYKARGEAFRTLAQQRGAT